MAFCKKCGTQMNDDMMFCPNCGEPQAVTQQPVQPAPQQTYTTPQPAPAANDTGSIGWGVLGFCFPIVGLILFLVWKDSKPMSGKKAGIGALVGVILSVVVYAISFAIGMSSAMYY